MTSADNYAQIELKLARLIAHFESEFGNAQTTGNLNLKFATIRDELKDLKESVKSERSRIQVLIDEIDGTSERMGLRTQVRFLWKTHTAGWALIGTIIGFALRGVSGL